MVVYTKGDVIDIFPGVEFIERSNADKPASHAVVVSDVKIINRDNGMRQFEWQARIMPSNCVINYLITEMSEAYGPTLYSIGSERYRIKFGEEALPFEKECVNKHK